jgi:hypothetical protein
MVRVSVEVRSGSTSFRATVWAEDIEQALSLAEACYPRTEINVIFPIEPEEFFVSENVRLSRVVHAEMPDEAAG